MVAEGVTWTDPEPVLTVPIPGEIETEVAFKTTQARVEVPPGAICDGEAVNVATVTGLTARMLTVVVAVPIRPSVFFTVNRK